MTAALAITPRAPTRLFLDVERSGQSDVAVKMAFVKLIENERLNTSQRGVLDQLAQEQSLGLELDPRDRAGDVEKNLIAGVEVTERELLNIFQRHGIRKIETVGAKFDPNYHQAIYEVPTSEKPPGIVMQEMQAGYAVGERCLRPAMVGVSKAEG